METVQAIHAPVSGGRLFSPLSGGLRRRVARAQSDLRKPDLTVGYGHIDIGFTEGAMLTAVTLVLMTWVCVRFRLNSGFLIVFALGAVLIASSWMGYFNLRRLRLRASPIAPVHAGQDARVAIQVAAPGRAVRSLELICEEDGRVTDLQPGQEWATELLVPTRRRGWQAGPQVALQTPYPFNLWRVFAVWVPVERFLVYPAIDLSVQELPRTLSLQRPDQPQEGLAPVSSFSGDSFSSLRPYRQGDSLRSIAWRAAARYDEGLLSKQMDGVEPARSHRVHLSLTDMLRDSTSDLEQTLSRLAAYILIAEHSGIDYSVEAGGRLIESDTAAGGKPAGGLLNNVERSRTQLHRSLALLALFPELVDR